MTTQNAIESLTRYRDDKIPTGGFLGACLENNLKEALGRADIESRANLFEIVSFIYNKMPASIQGSPEKVKAHLDSRE